MDHIWSYMFQGFSLPPLIPDAMGAPSPPPYRWVAKSSPRLSPVVVVVVLDMDVNALEACRPPPPLWLWCVQDGMQDAMGM